MKSILKRFLNIFQGEHSDVLSEFQSKLRCPFFDERQFFRGSAKAYDLLPVSDDG